MFFASDTDVVVGVAESTAGTFVQPVSADYTAPLMEAQVSIEIPVESHKYANGSHARSLGTPGAKPATFKAKTPLVWSGSYATGIGPEQFIKSCGHTKTEYKRAVLVAGSASGQKVVPVSTTGSPFTQGQVVTLKEGAKTENCTIATVGTNALTMVANLANTYTGAGYVHTGIGYQPLAASDDSTMSISAYEKQSGAASPSAVKLDVAGMVGSIEIMADGIGKDLMIGLDMQGKYVDVTDEVYANIPTPTGGCNNVPDTLLGTTLTVGGVSVAVSKFSLNSTHGITRLSDQSDASGYLYGHIDTRAPVVSFDPIRTEVSVDGGYDDLINATTGEIILTTAHFQIRVPKAQVSTQADTPREGFHAWEKTYDCLENCGATGAVIDTALTKECTYEIIMGRRC